MGYRIAHHADLDGPPQIDVIEVTDGLIDLPGEVVQVLRVETSRGLECVKGGSSHAVDGPGGCLGSVLFG